MEIGYIGLGNMGGGMAKSLLNRDFSVNVFDIRAECGPPLVSLGANWCDSPAALAAASDVVFTSLPGPSAVEEIVYGKDGISQGLRTGSVYVDMTTNSPILLRRIHEDLGGRGIAVMDAAVSGLISDAHSGNLSLFVGGDPDVFKRIEPALLAMGPRVNFMGPIGSGMVTKIVHNQLCITTMAIMAEGFTLGKKYGLDIEALYRAVAGGTFGQRKLVEILPNVIFTSSYEVDGSHGMPLSYGRKDLALATQLGRDLDVPLGISALVEQDLVAATARGWSSKEATIFTTLQQERANVSLDTRT